MAGFEPANLGTKGQHATSRPPKPLFKHFNTGHFSSPVVACAHLYLTLPADGASAPLHVDFKTYIQFVIVLCAFVGECDRLLRIMYRISNREFEFSRQIFEKNPYILNLTKVRPVAAELFNANRHDEANSRFSKLFEST